jgi:mono/diheme cytochrome c family protein
VPAALHGCIIGLGASLPVVHHDEAGFAAREKAFMVAVETHGLNRTGSTGPRGRSRIPVMSGLGGRQAAMVAAVAVTTLLTFPAMGSAQNATPEEGRRIAERYCARCHVVSPEGGAGWTDAPAFVDLAQDRRISRAWMRDFVTKLHMHMLHTERSPAEADAITAYLLSLRERR